MQRVDQSGVCAEDVKKCLAAGQQLANVGKSAGRSVMIHLPEVELYLLTGSHPSLASFHAVPNIH